MIIAGCEKSTNKVNVTETNIFGKVQKNLN